MHYITRTIPKSFEGPVILILHMYEKFYILPFVVFVMCVVKLDKNEKSNAKQEGWIDGLLIVFL